MPKIFEYFGFIFYFKWVKFFVMKKAVRSTNITKKI